MDFLELSKLGHTILKKHNDLSKCLESLIRPVGSSLPLWVRVEGAEPSILFPSPIYFVVVNPKIFYMDTIINCLEGSE